MKSIYNNVMVKLTICRIVDMITYVNWRFRKGISDVFDESSSCDVLVFSWFDHMTVRTWDSLKPSIYGHVSSRSAFEDSDWLSP